MPTKQAPYVILNDTLVEQVQSRSFSSFPRLPLEIRNKIWTESILSERLVQISFANKWPQSLPIFCTDRNELGNLISGYPYHLQTTVPDDWSPETLLKVNHEAGAAFRRIYRLRLPLPVKARVGGEKVLYINPDNDIIWIQCKGSTVSLDESLSTAFLHDLVAYDPKGVGVVHLALNVEEHQLLLRKEPKYFPEPFPKSITTILSTSLRSVYFVIKSTRAMLSIFTSTQSKWHHNRSVPILANKKSFSVIGKDPRPIKADLTHVLVGVDPRQSLWMWHSFMINFGVQRKIPSRYIVSSEGTSGTRDGFIETLQRNDQVWLRWTRRCEQPIWGERTTKEEYEIQRSKLPQAAGVWVFPEETFGKLPAVPDQYWTPKMVADISAFQPELWAFHLSTGRGVGE